MGTCTTFDMLPGKHAGGRATICRGSCSKRRRVRANEPFDVWILEKVWVSDTNSYERSDCFAFKSFWAANRAMFDDWTEEYMDRPDAPNEGEDGWEFEEDQFWCQQSRPSEEDDESEINFKDGSSIKWKIYNRSIEGLSPMWDEKDEQ